MSSTCQNELTGSSSTIYLRSNRFIKILTPIPFLSNETPICFPHSNCKYYLIEPSNSTNRNITWNFKFFSKLNNNKPFKSSDVNNLKSFLFWRFCNKIIDIYIYRYTPTTIQIRTTHMKPLETNEQRPRYSYIMRNNIFLLKTTSTTCKKNQTITYTHTYKIYNKSLEH